MKNVIKLGSINQYQTTVDFVDTNEKVSDSKRSTKKN